jgi:hypothetical protein
MDLDPQARRLLELTRQAHTPRPRDKARMDQLLGPTLALGPSSVRAAPRVAARNWLGTTSAAKWSSIALLAMAGGAAYFAWRAPHVAQAPLPPPPPLAAAAPSLAAAAGVDPEANAAAIAEPNEATADEHAPSTIRTRTTARVAAHPKLVEATLPAELDLLHDAQSQWRAGNAAGALSLLEKHRKRFPRSQLAAERDALTVLSLCRTNRTAEARAVAKRFLQTTPRSPLRTSVEESCAAP